MSEILWTRTRSRSTNYDSSLYWWTTRTGTNEHGLNPPAWPPTSQWNGASGESTSQTTLDMESPNWRSRIEDGEVICHPYSTTKIINTASLPQAMETTYSDNRSGIKIWCSTHGTYHPRVTSTVGVWQQAKGLYLETFPGGVSADAMRLDVMNRAVIAAKANIDTSEMLALATVAESRKTVDSACNILRRAYKVFRAVRKLNFRALRNEISPKELSDRYMEARYAIRPMAYDIYGIAMALQKTRGYERRTFRGQAEDSMHNEDVLIGSTQPTSNDWKRTIDLEYSAYAGVLCDVAVSEISVWGIDQIAETMWELTPWSFVIDWFANVGDWIAAHTPNAGVRQRASWVTIRKSLKKTQTVSAVRWNLVAGQTAITLNPPKATYTQEELVLERVVDPDISTFPSTNLRLDAYKLTDLTIMIRNSLK